ncbi:MAG TPA: type II toxin-antitoxin system VapC family toxin [Candidatus Limnocylindrales bacterium]
MPEKHWSADDLHKRQTRIAIDANVLIYLLENAEPHASRAAVVIDAINQHQIGASLATVGQVEILTGPARSGDATTFERMADELRSLDLRLVGLSAAIAEDAAWLRGTEGIDLVDAIHLASARSAGATAFVTNDRGIRSRAGLEVLYLDDLVLEDPPARG